MAPKALSAFRPGVYRVGLFEGYGVNERGENEMRLQGASAARPFRIRLDYAVNPWTKEDISCEGLKPGEDMVIVCQSGGAVCSEVRYQVRDRVGAVDRSYRRRAACSGAGRRLVVTRGHLAGDGATAGWVRDGAWSDPRQGGGYAGGCRSAFAASGF